MSCASPADFPSSSSSSQTIPQAPASQRDSQTSLVSSHQLRHRCPQHKEQFWLQARGKAKIKFCFSCLWLRHALLKMELQKIQLTLGFFRNILFVFVFKIVFRADLHCNKEVIFLWQVLQLLKYSSESFALMKAETVRKTNKQFSLPVEL